MLHILPRVPPLLLSVDLTHSAVGDIIGTFTIASAYYVRIDVFCSEYHFLTHSAQRITSIYSRPSDNFCRMCHPSCCSRLHLDIFYVEYQSSCLRSCSHTLLRTILIRTVAICFRFDIFCPVYRLSCLISHRHVSCITSAACFRIDMYRVSPQFLAFASTSIVYHLSLFRLHRPTGTLPRVGH